MLSRCPDVGKAILRFTKEQTTVSRRRREMSCQASRVNGVTKSETRRSKPQCRGNSPGGRAVHCGEGFVIWFWTLVNISWTLNEFYRFCLAAKPYLQVSSCGTSKTKASQGGLLRVGTSKNKGARSSAPWLAFVLEVPLCDVCLSMCTFISCDWIMQRAHCYQPPSCLFCLTNSICSFTFLRTIYWQTVFELSVLDCRARN